MTTASPALFPENGVRKLSPKETMQRMKALSCTLPKDNRPTCSGQVHVGIFFDGTGNNMKDDFELPPPEKRKHSNVVRIFHTHRSDPKNGYLSYYIPGVGTPFPEIGDSNKYLGGFNRGSIGAEKGEDRLIWAFTRLLNAPHRFVFGVDLISNDLAKTIVGNVATPTSPGAMRRVVLNTWQDKLKTALAGQKPKVEQINLSVFGFSRGAAEARTFVNWLFEVCKQEGGGWAFAGIPIRLQFLGIFDTVASVGAANLFDNGVVVGHQGWADNTQEIHPAVEQCVHFVAGHEVRACFPLDSVRVKSHYPANAMEVMYPGSHSDVGGGYAPGELGVSPQQDSFMSMIPGVNMYHEARKAGVPLKPLSDLRKEYQDALTPSATAIADFNAYVRESKISSGPVEEMARRHMSLYFSYRFKHRAAFYQRAPYVTATPKDQEYLRETQKCLIERLSRLGSHGNAMASDFDPAQMAELHEKMMRAAGLQLGLKEKHAIQVAKRIDTHAIKPGIEHFFDRYIHDSMAGFIGFGMPEYTFNGIGIVKFRTVFKGHD